MLVELAVHDLGVIADLRLDLGPGMTALTGETGAGKTLLVTAIELLTGGRADGTVVRPGAGEARVEGRFVVGDGDDDEIVLTRVVPAEGRSRAYVDGRLAPVAALAEHGRALVDLHGQHAHQSLLAARAQRAALDRFAGTDLGPLRAARGRLAELEAALAALGGDARARAREIDLLRFQVEELAAAAIDDPDEDARLEAEEDVLADATAHREAAVAAHAALVDEAGAVDAVAAALAAVAGRGPFADVEARLRSSLAELTTLAADVRVAGEAIEDDPDRLESIRHRRQLLRDLRRKYGETLAEVAAYGEEAARRLAELEGHDERAAALEAARTAVRAAEREAAAAVGATRRSAAADLARAVEGHLGRLAMPRARFEVVVGDEDPGDDVSFLLGANAGEPTLPLAKVASGGELARTMLGLRLVMVEMAPEPDGPERERTLVFDEVDAGIGGEAALAVGRALASLAQGAQVLVVTHLPQVAAFADAQVAVSKGDDDGRTVASASLLDDAGRVVELSRMLSGQPGSSAAHEHAEELLALALQERRR